MRKERRPQLADLRFAAKKAKPQRANHHIGLVTPINVGVAFARRRNELGWTQNRLSALSGVTAQYVSMIEIGKCNPTIFLLLTLAEALGVPLSELIAEAESEARLEKRTI